MDRCWQIGPYKLPTCYQGISFIIYGIKEIASEKNAFTLKIKVANPKHKK